MSVGDVDKVKHVVLLVLHLVLHNRVIAEVPDVIRCPTHKTMGALVSQRVNCGKYLRHVIWATEELGIEGSLAIEGERVHLGRKVL